MISIFCAWAAGIGMTFLWVAHGRYVTLCADDSNKGFFNSVFWVFMMTCQVVGNIMGGTIITKVAQSTFFGIFFIIAVVASLWMIGLPTPKPYPDADAGDVELVPYAGSPPAGEESKIADKKEEVANEVIVEDANAAEQQKLEEGVVKEKSNVRVIGEFVITKRWLQFSPIVFFSGISMAYYTGLFVPLLSRTMGNVSSAEKTSQACFAMIGFGAGEIIGSLVNGKLNDCLGINRFLYVCLFEMVLAYVFLFWYN